MNTQQSPVSVEEFFSHYTSMRYDKAERILRENEEPSGVFLIKSGIVREYLISEEGNELSIMLQPETSIFPLRWALNRQPNIYNYQAMGPVEVWRAPRDAFERFLVEHPEQLMALTKQVINDTSTLVYRMQHIVFGNAQAKVASVVLTAAKRFGSNDGDGKPLKVSIALTHQQIADTAGVTRETASLEMKKLQETGLIAYEGRIIVITELAKLSKLAYL